MAYKQIGIMKLAGAFWSTYDCTFQGEGRSINVNWKGQGVFFGTGVANLVGGWTVDPNTLPRQIWFHTFAESKAGGAMVIEFRKKRHHPNIGHIRRTIGRHGHSGAERKREC